MSKLSEIVFKPIQSKEFEIMGHKILLRSLTTKDTIEMDIELNENLKSKDLLIFAVKVLSRSIVSIDGVSPDNVQETKTFLENQSSDIVFSILNKYQELTSIPTEEIKN